MVVVRHPMPYGDLVKQRVQRFSSFEDLDRHDCTIEEREEYEPHLAEGVVVYAGVDYEAILRHAEAECDVLLWDGGNNDLPFYRPTVEIVVADPHRAGHELRYHPREAQFNQGSGYSFQQDGLRRQRGDSDAETQYRREQSDGDGDRGVVTALRR